MRTLFTLVLALFFLSSIAQDELTNKKGVKILPETGDYAVGVDAAPALNYFGNLFNNTANNNIAFNFINNGNTIIAKKMINPNMAMRAALRIRVNSQTNKAYVRDDVAFAQDPNSTATVEDVEKISGSIIAIGAGIEKRRGTTRLIGFYGAEAGIALGTGKTTYEYGNEITQTNNFPTTNDFGTNTSGIAYRYTEQKFGTNFGFSVRSFVGVEYFILPKVSLSGEFGWGLTFVTTGEGEGKEEIWNITNSNVEDISTKIAGNNDFTLDTDNFNGAISLFFYF